MVELKRKNKTRMVIVDGGVECVGDKDVWRKYFFGADSARGGGRESPSTSECVWVMGKHSRYNKFKYDMSLCQLKPDS